MRIGPTVHQDSFLGAALLLVELGFAMEVGEALPVDHVAFNELFDNVLVVKDELLLVFIQHFVVLEVVPAQFLNGVVLEFKLRSRLVLFLHVFRVFFSPFENVLVDFSNSSGRYDDELVTNVFLPEDYLFSFVGIGLQLKGQSLQVLVIQGLTARHSAKDIFQQVNSLLDVLTLRTYLFVFVVWEGH